MVRDTSVGAVLSSYRKAWELLSCCLQRGLIREFRCSVTRVRGHLTQE
jgi:hypothetical protein